MNQAIILCSCALFVAFTAISWDDIPVVNSGTSLLIQVASKL